MPVLDPGHLVDQAKYLLARAVPGSDLQVDLRRAISAAYYAVFHCVLTAVADEFVGEDRRNSARYGLVYRSVDHGAIRRLCDEISRKKPSVKYALLLPERGMDSRLVDFATFFVRLQRFRHEADYNPARTFVRTDVQFAILTAIATLDDFALADSEGRQLFLTLLAFPPR